MFQHFIFLLTLQLLLGGLLGWWAGVWGSVAGVVFASWMYLGWLVINRSRLLEWLRKGANEQEMPTLESGLAEVSARLLRILRLKIKEVDVAEAHLQELFAMLQASPNGVLLLNENGLIEWFNEIAAQHFGFDKGRDKFQLLGNLLRDPVFNAYYLGNNYSQGVTLEGRESTASRPVRVAVQIYPYGEGKRLILSHDITAIEQADVMRRDFVANVSHEIRTPLTVLAGFLETMTTLELSPDSRMDYLKKMSRQAVRMRQLVEDLLVLSRLEGNPLPGYENWIPVKQLLAHCEEEGKGLSQLLNDGKLAHDFTIVLDEQLERSEIAGVDAELRGAFSNLVNNAVRYTPAHGKIIVRWQKLPNGNASFSVQDSGPGIDEAFLPRLTERFYRVDKGRSRDTGGTGLGLAIVKHVAQRHGGHLEINSKVGEGSTFTIIFPASRMKLPADNRS